MGRDKEIQGSCRIEAALPSPGEAILSMYRAQWSMELLERSGESLELNSRNAHGNIAC
jgi:hypothetical protein